MSIKYQLWFTTHSRMPKGYHMCSNSHTRWIKTMFTWSLPLGWMPYNCIQRLSVLYLIWVILLWKTGDRKISKVKCKNFYIFQTEYKHDIFLYSSQLIIHILFDISEQIFFLGICHILIFFDKTFFYMWYTWNLIYFSVGLNS